jgi:hypothetical protein
MKPKNRSNHATLCLISALALGLCAAARAGDSPQPPQSNAFGKSLEDWQDTYWRWALGEVSIKPDANGNAVVRGNVVLMPLPSAPGDGTAASLDVTLKSGQPFMMPLLMLLGNSYSDGTPNDVFASSNDFRNINLSLKLDGVEIMNGSNAIQYYTQSIFDPSIPLAGSPPASAWIWFQGIGMVHTPLSLGVHTLTLDTKNTYPEYNFSVEYHNTWHITVQP